ncbi:TRAFs-binding domain-containing protein [Novosphingobium sp.]|uniref:TRAFs-binding domain-containing protein n=1 Tax=Novosphingobium sp. TaxID=1874826 RepID=UPI0028A89251|nr:TRAFs-binding domain-containing protein [Novosphingobium sp.]
MTLPALARIRQIARAGDTLRAWRMFEASALPQSSAPEALSLKGRLLKDRGLRSEGDERRQLLQQAQAAYLAAAGDRRATYPLINAATIAFLNDRVDEARGIARHILEILRSGAHEQETRYWLAATEAEALLLLDDAKASREALEHAMAAAPEAWEDHAVTLRQFRQILKRLGRSPDLFDHLEPPPSLYFYGIIGLPDDESEARAKLEQALDEIRPGAVFGALAAGADILVAELALKRGARLHVVLPTSIARFREISVRQYGMRWVERFDRLVEEADVVDVLGGNSELSQAAILDGSRVAMGLALRHARILATRALALHVSRGTDDAGGWEAHWRAHGLPVHKLVLDDTLPPRGGGLAPASSRAVLGSPGPLPPVSGNVPIEEVFAEGGTIRAFADLPTAMDHALAVLRSAPDLQLGLDQRAVALDHSLEIDCELAILLARAAPSGSICASWPQAAALDLLTPDCRFESAGEIVTAMGDVPIGLFCPRSAI